jgi:hypothetical protein
VNGWSAKVSVRGNGRPGAGVCSTTLAGSSSTLTTQESDVEMPCTWAQITTTPGCEAMNTPNPQNNQYCNAPIDVTAEHLDANRTATLNRSGYVVQ